MNEFIGEFTPATLALELAAQEMIDHPDARRVCFPETEWAIKTYGPNAAGLFYAIMEEGSTTIAQLQKSRDDKQAEIIRLRNQAAEMQAEMLELNSKLYDMPYEAQPLPDTEPDTEPTQQNAWKLS